MKRATASVLVCLVILMGCISKSDLEDANNKIKGLQAQVASAKAENEKLQTENAQLKESISSLPGHGAEMKSKPILPITMKIRKAVTGPGYVAMFDTTVKSPVTVLATLHSAALGTTKQFGLHLDRAVRAELGQPEGAVIEKGDTITLENTNYEPASFEIKAP